MINNTTIIVNTIIDENLKLINPMHPPFNSHLKLLKIYLFVLLSMFMVLKRVEVKTWRKPKYMDDFIKQIEWRKTIEYATSKAGSAVVLQSTYIETFPLSGCNKLGFPSSACTCVANKHIMVSKTTQYI